MSRKLRVLELFAGIGACSKALEKLGIDFEIVDAVEIDKYAIKSFNAVHGTNFEPQDITTWDKDLEDIDLLTHGSPCQDISVAGLQKGANEGSGTRSSLMYETIRIVDKIRPKYVLWENVKNLISKRHFPNFQAYIDRMSELGYTSYYKVLNAKNFGVPQNRERVFTVSIRNDISEEYTFPIGEETDQRIEVVGNYMPSGHDASRVVDESGIAPTVKENHGTVTAVARGFNFPEPKELKIKLKDILDDEVDEKYYLPDSVVEKIENNIKENPTFVSRHYNNFIDKNGYIPEKFNAYNELEIQDIAPTQTTFCDSSTSSASVLIKSEVGSSTEIINPLKGNSGYSWQFEQQVYDANGITRTVKAGGGSGNIPKIIEEDEVKSSYTRNFGSKGKIQSGEVCSTLTAAMGSGGGNVPLVGVDEDE